MRPLLATAAVLLAAAPVSATPTVDVPDVQRHLTGTAAVHVLASDRAVYRLGVFASVVYAESTTPYSWVVLEVGKCVKGRCGTPVRYHARLDPGRFDAADPKKWSITLSAFGKPFTVTWTGPGPEDEVPEDFVQAGTAVSASTSWDATATVTALGRACPAPRAVATQGTTVWATGFQEPTGMVPLPNAAPPGQPRAATACRATA